MSPIHSKKKPSQNAMQARINEIQARINVLKPKLEGLNDWLDQYRHERPRDGEYYSVQGVAIDYRRELIGLYEEKSALYSTLRY